MARMRSIKPEFWTDLKLSRISRDARLLYIALWNLADEHARVHGDTRYIKGHCLPYDDDLSLDDIDGLLDELSGAGRMLRYEVDGDPYLFLRRLAKHQRLESSKVPSRLPAPPEPDPSLPGNRRSDGISESRANKSAPDSDTFAPGADPSEPIVALHVAGSRLQVAGSKGKNPRPPAADTTAAFEEFWDAWGAHAPKVARKEAERSLVRALRDTDLDTVISAASAFVASERRKGTDPKFVPHASTWLNGRRWEDEAPAPAVNSWENFRAVPL